MKPSSRRNGVSTKRAAKDKVRNSCERRGKDVTKQYQGDPVLARLAHRLSGAFAPVDQGVLQGSRDIKRLTPRRVDQWGVGIR
jgi:hypothetical protein